MYDILHPIVLLMFAFSSVWMRQAVSGGKPFAGKGVDSLLS